MAGHKAKSKPLAAMLKGAHSPAARAKAHASIKKMAAKRQEVAARYGEPPSAFLSSRMLATIERKKIPLIEIPVELFHPFPIGKRNALLAQRAGGAPAAKGNGGNGHGGPVEISFPLDAIPERVKHERATTYHKRTAPHSALLIEKMIDRLVPAHPSEQFSTRFLYVVDKLLSG